MEKNCEFEKVTPAELIASKFLSVIGRSTGDSELKKNFRKSDMTIETITALIHEHMYDQLNDSNIQMTEKKSNTYKNDHTNENERTSPIRTEQRPQYQKQKQRDNRCGQCGAPNWSRQHVCPPKMAECRKCERRGHHEKMCRSIKRVQYVERTTSLAEGRRQLGIR